MSSNEERDGTKPGDLSIFQSPRSDDSYKFPFKITKVVKTNNQP